MQNFWDQLAMKKPFLALAPMYDVTDVAFREVVAEVAAPDVFFTEFVNCEALMTPGGREAHLAKFEFTQKQKPIVAQIWGVTPESFETTANLIKSLGFDGIDLNMGCPEKSVMKIGACSALIENRSLAKEIILATRAGSGGLPVSVKTRIGIKHSETEDWMGWLLEQNLSALTVHGRTVKEMSEVSAHWDEIEKTVRLRDQMKQKTLIIGNGDVVNAVEAEKCAKLYGVDGVMIGRGIFKDLFAFDKHKRFAEIAWQEKIKWLNRHIELFEKYRNARRNPEVMKKFVKVYVSGFPEAKEIRQKLLEADGLDGLKMELQKIL
jgi:tRNA-dihydrouridine synthase